MKPTVVIGYPGFGDIEIEKEILRSIDAHVLHTGTMDTPTAREAVRNADAVMVTIQPVPADLIASMERCRIIARVGTGLDAINIEAATQHGIWVTYVPDYSIDEVSTHTITLLLAQARGLATLLRSTRSGRWDSSGVHVRRLQGQVLGLIGCGRIGLATAAKAHGLGLEVIVHDPYTSADALTAAGVRAVDLPTLLSQSDYISLHMPLTRDNRHMINAAALAQMKPSAYLINTARGPLIDETALFEAVQTGVIAGAGLDVLSVEPPASDNPLLNEDRILITPHTAWYSEEAKVDVRRRGAEEVVRVLRNDPPRAPVNHVDAR
ncbi:MAG: C-terminal binding protein [Caldilineaceae bacterium]|nr:C-terminal binding protein [Caldilineaceae bacterium]